MKTNKNNLWKSSVLLLALSAAIFSSCDQNEDAVSPAMNEEEIAPTIEPTVWNDQNENVVLSKMKALSGELYSLSTMDKPRNSSNTSMEEFSVPPPYYGANTGSVYINRNFTGQSSPMATLNFGNRAPEHTTQWIALQLMDYIRVTDVGSGAPNNVGKGYVRFNLSGIGQSVTLKYTVNAPSAGGFRTVTITPSSSASFLQNLVAPSPIVLGLGGGTPQLTIHANEFGWLWLRIEQDGLIKVDQHYRFNYSSTLDSRNGGSITMSGYNRIGTFIPYSVFAAEQAFSGYCGWFKE